MVFLIDEWLDDLWLIMKIIIVVAGIAAYILYKLEH